MSTYCTTKTLADGTRKTYTYPRISRAKRKIVDRGLVKGAYTERLGFDGHRTHLIGRGGVGLVMYHLARLGIEFVVPPHDCAHGDLWAVIGSRRFGIEVKTTRNATWNVKPHQLHVVDFYVFVHLDTSACWVLTTDEVLSALDGRCKPEGVVLHRDDVHAGYNAWEKLAMSEVTDEDQSSLAASA